jgi:hypothetical protein
MTDHNAGEAQMGERRLAMPEVAGSTPAVRSDETMTFKLFREGIRLHIETNAPEGVTPEQIREAVHHATQAALRRLEAEMVRLFAPALPIEDFGPVYRVPMPSPTYRHFSLRIDPRILRKFMLPSVEGL